MLLCSTFCVFFGGNMLRNGPEWWRLRSEVQKELSTTQNVRSFLPDIDRVTRQFVLDYLPRAQPFEALDLITRLNLECM